MPVEAYAIGINLVGNAEKLVSENNKVIQSLERVQASLKSTQGAMNDMMASLRGAGRVAASLAASMAQVAASARDAATASARIKAPNGGGSGGGMTPGSAAPSRASSFSSSAMADVAANVAAQQAAARRGPPMLPAPPDRLRLGYDPGTNARDPIGGGNAYSAGVAGTGFTMGPSGPTISPQRPNAPASAPYSPYQSTGVGGALVPAGGGNLPAVPGQGPIPLNIGRVPRVPNLPRLPTLPPVSPGMKLLGGYAGYETVKGAYEQGAEVDDILAKMATMRVQGADGRSTPAFTPAMIARSKTMALGMMRSTPGLGYAGALDVVLQTAGLLGDANEAIQAAPGLAFNAQVLSRYGKGDAVTQIEKAVQAGELTGLTGANGKINVPRLLDFTNRLTQTSVAMGGQLDLGKYLTGIRQFGLGSDAASLEFLTADLPAYMKIMGERRAGTALSSLQQVMLAYTPNTRNKAVMTEQRRLGLRDAKGAATFRGDLTTDPNAYIMDVLGRLGTQGYTSRDQIVGELYKLFPRQTIDRLVGAGIFDRALINKEVGRNRAQQQAGMDPLMALLNNAPGAQFQKFAEGFKALEAVTTDAAMGPTMSIIDRLTKSFYNITDYVKSHPKDVITFVGEIDALVKMILGVAKTVGSVYAALPGPLRSAVVGAAGGAAIGSVIPGVGTGVGAVIGGVGGLVKGGIDATGGSSRSGILTPQQRFGGLFHQEAYVTGGGGMGMGQMANITINLDGKTIARYTQQLITQDVRAGSRRGSNWDPIASVPSPGQMVRA